MAVEIQKTEPRLLPSWSSWMLGSFRNLTGKEIHIWNSCFSFRKQLTLCLKLGVQTVTLTQVFSHPGPYFSVWNVSDTRWALHRAVHVLKGRATQSTQWPHTWVCTSDLDRAEQPDLNSPHSEDYLIFFILQLWGKSETCSLSGCSRVNKTTAKHCKPTAWTCIQDRSLPWQQQQVVRKQRMRSTNARSTLLPEEIKVFENAVLLKGPLP